MYLNRSSGTYRCSSYKYGTHCPAPCTVHAVWVDDYVTDEFLKAAGQIQINRVIEIPGYDPQPEIDATLAEFEEHQQEKGRQKSKSAQTAWQRRADALDARLAELESREKREPRREVVPTGRTYADDWNEGDTTERRAMLIAAGARLMVKPGSKGGWRRLDPRRVDFTITGELDPAIAELAAVTGDAEAEARNDAPPAPGSSVHLAEPEPVHTVAEPATSPVREHPEPAPAPAEPARALVAA
ncbi:hypothetical protein RB200_39205 [Streptomyces sp. PmtG]